jgi:AcrR family transcriptional regulator
VKENNLRQRLLDTAGRLFYEQGYKQTGINQIIEEAAIARGSFYYHFSSKAELLAAYLDRFVNDWFVGADAYLAKITDPKARITGLIDYRITNQKKRGLSGCALLKANAGLEAGDDELRQHIRILKQKMHDYVAKVVAASGHRQILSNEALTDMVVLLSDGGLVGTAIYHNTNDLEKANLLISQLI